MHIKLMNIYGKSITDEKVLVNISIQFLFRQPYKKLNKDFPIFSNFERTQKSLKCKFLIKKKSYFLWKDYVLEVLLLNGAKYMKESIKIYFPPK